MDKMIEMSTKDKMRLDSIHEDLMNMADKYETSVEDLIDMAMGEETQSEDMEESDDMEEGKSSGMDSAKVAMMVKKMRGMTA
jgi:hypothetical protein